MITTRTGAQLDEIDLRGSRRAVTLAYAIGVLLWLGLAGAAALERNWAFAAVFVAGALGTGVWWWFARRRIGRGADALALVEPVPVTVALLGQATYYKYRAWRTQPVVLLAAAGDQDPSAPVSAFTLVASRRRAAELLQPGARGELYLDPRDEQERRPGFGAPGDWSFGTRRWTGAWASMTKLVSSYGRQALPLPRPPWGSAVPLAARTWGPAALKVGHGTLWVES